MAVVQLEDAEWQAVLGLMSLGPWREADPLLMKIGQQLQHQAQQEPLKQPIGKGIRLDGNGREIRDE